MKLQQFRYIVEVVNNNLNVSLAAEKLFTSQPGVSKQIKLLEDELGVTIFTRTGKHLSGLTRIGEQIIPIAQEVLDRANEIKMIAKEYNDPNEGTLSVATTYTHSKYILPEAIQAFKSKYNNISLHLEQCSSEQSIAKVKDKSIDFAIVSDLSTLSEDLIALPCYHWNKVIISPKEHPIASSKVVSIQDLVNYPLICYELSREGSAIEKIFKKASLTPNIVFSAIDPDLIKTYVRLGMGVGIVAKMAIDKNHDDLAIISAGHIFPYTTTYIVFLRSLYIRNYMYAFIHQLAEHLDRQTVDNALLSESNNTVSLMFSGMKLPIK